jgi:hypothetical protein
MGRGQKKTMQNIIKELQSDVQRCDDFVLKLEDAVTCGLSKRARKLIEEEHD